MVAFILDVPGDAFKPGLLQGGENRMPDDPYETHVDAYEAWFIQNDRLFATELDAIRELMPDFQRGMRCFCGLERS